MNLSKAFEHKREGICPNCEEIVKVEDFKDALSLKEWTISGLCFRCQCAIFGHEDDQDDEEHEEKTF